MTKQEFIKFIAPYAVEHMKKNGVLASVTIAQAILESGYGNTDLAVNANNFFGMKCFLSGNTWGGSTWDGVSKYTKITKEDDGTGKLHDEKADFRKYPSAAESVEDHSAYLLGAMNGNKKRYAGLQGETEPRKAITIIKRGGYATGTTYVKKIMQIIAENNLTQYDKKITERKVNTMNIFLCVGHADYGNGMISSADGTKKGGVNEYKYNKALAPYIVKWLQSAGQKATLCIAPEGKLHSLNEEINYFIGEEHKENYDLSIQLHLNAFNGNAYGAEAYAYNAAGLKVAERICNKLGTVWHNRGANIRTGLYWTRKTKAKAVLIESFFCDNAADYEKAKKLGYDAHGKLIAEGIIGKDIQGDATEKTPTAKPPVESSAIKYRVQIGAYKNRKNAEAMKDKLKKAGFDAIIKEV